MNNLKISQLQPLAGYALVEPAAAEEKTASGIILTNTESEKPQYGTVLAVGAAECQCDDCGCGSCGCGDCGCGDCGCGDHDEQHTPTKKPAKTKSASDASRQSCGCDCGCGEAPVSVGDMVVYKEWGGNKVTINDTEYQFLKFEDILATVKK